MKFDIGIYQDRLSGQIKFERQLTILRVALKVFICNSKHARTVCELALLVG
jgi:hypothetical protein